MEPDVETSLLAVLKKYWGYDSFLPLQREAMGCLMQSRDSLVVLPTGGGKSLCFQAPALCLDGMAVVVSPLISLMKDQVDALVGCGVPAACVNSSQSPDVRREIFQQARDGQIKLLYVAPERLVTARMLDFLGRVQLSTVAIDEAHCISAWGHDFRPEYRELRRLKDTFPNLSVHAYTATATPQVREDIAVQLGLSDAEILVGSFDRPNLIYRVARRAEFLRQLRDVLGRHQGESGVIYCISRAEVDRLAGQLAAEGYRSLPYHAGMADDQRRKNQEAFIEERADIIVATVAFGMGIDKSNVRYVIHAGMPKSLENYQQEAGRAGRDGLEAECCLFFSGRDYGVWKSIVEDSESEDARAGAIKSLSHMYEFATGVVCRHRVLVNHFGQDYEAKSCGACDVCLGDLELTEDPLVIGQKILSCVMRLQERFGGDYTAKVLRGSNEQRILQAGHDQLSTFGLLADEDHRAVRDWIEQLVGQNYLAKEGEYNVLRVTDSGWRVLRGEEAPRLLKPKRPSKRKPAKEKEGVAADSWEGVDQGLFESLRELRRTKATERSVPPYMVFGDATLRELARNRPTSVPSFRQIRGVGDKKCADFGDEFVEHIVTFCDKHGVETDVSS